MLKSNERWIIHYHVHLEPVPRTGPTNLPLANAMRAIRTRFDAGTANGSVDGVDLRIHAFRETATYVEILLTNFDPRGADHAYGTAATGTVRTLNRVRGESNAYSAHVVIRRTPDAVDGSGREMHRMLIEDIPGIGKTRVLPFLNSLIADDVRDFVNRQGQTEQFYARLGIWPFKSESLAEEMESGALRHFELVKEYSERQVFDEAAFNTEVSEVMKVKVKPTVTQTFAQIFEKVRGTARRRGFTRVKVVYKGSEGNQRSINFNPQRQDLEDVFQAKYEKVDLTQRLTQCETIFSPELLRRMKAQIT